MTKLNYKMNTYAFYMPVIDKNYDRETLEDLVIPYDGLYKIGFYLFEWNYEKQRFDLADMTEDRDDAIKWAKERHAELKEKWYS